MTLGLVLTGERRGVFRLDGPTNGLFDAARDLGWRVVTLDTAGAVDKEGFMTAVDDAFDLPEWFGRSWDALDECLRALDLDDPDGLLVLWENWDGFAIADPDAFETAIDVFRDATVAWHDDETPGAVVLPGDGPETDLPFLTR